MRLAPFLETAVCATHDEGRAGRKPMTKIRFSRRDVFRASTAIAAGTVIARIGVTVRPAQAQARTAVAEPITPALIEAAKKEGKLAFYTAMDLPVAEKFARAFEAKY